MPTRTNLIPFKPLRMTSSTRFWVAAWEKLLQQVVGSLLIDPIRDRLGFQLVCSLWLPEPLFFVPRGMVATVASEENVAHYISKLDIVAIAVYNGPESHISRELKAIEKLTYGLRNWLYIKAFMSFHAPAHPVLKE